MFAGHGYACWLLMTPDSSCRRVLSETVRYPQCKKLLPKNVAAGDLIGQRRSGHVVWVGGAWGVAAAGESYNIVSKVGGIEVAGRLWLLGQVAACTGLAAITTNQSHL